MLRDLSRSWVVLEVLSSEKEKIRCILDTLVDKKIASRISAKDCSVWVESASEEASRRLGWLDVYDHSLPVAQSAKALRNDLLKNGVDRFVLSGMGGSSLASELMSDYFQTSLIVLDTTDPDHVFRVASEPLDRTSLILSSKSGSTLEVDSHRRLFEKHFKGSGIDPSSRIICITDPNSPLDLLAQEKGYRVFNADPSVGGRFSALTAFGIVPLVLCGIDVTPILSAAKRALVALKEDSQANPALILGALLAVEGKAAIASESLIGNWIEQLLAESTGKDLTGVLPIVTNGDLSKVRLEGVSYFDVRLEDGSRNSSENSSEKSIQSETECADKEFCARITAGLGEQFVLWEFATAVLGHILSINPFDQPDVEKAKEATRGILGNFKKPEDEPVISLQNGIKTLGGACTQNLGELLDTLGRAIPPSGYLAIQAYLDPKNDDGVMDLVKYMVLRYNRPVTFGWGPRFLHSTGQYHKGGPRIGSFLQLVTDSDRCLEIPGLGFDFGKLIRSQAAGDAQVLRSIGRPVLTLFVNSLEDLTLNLPGLEPSLSN